MERPWFTLVPPGTRPEQVAVPLARVSVLVESTTGRLAWVALADSPVLLDSGSLSGWHLSRRLHSAFIRLRFLDFYQTRQKSIVRSATFLDVTDSDILRPGDRFRVITKQKLRRSREQLGYYSTPCIVLTPVPPVIVDEDDPGVRRRIELLYRATIVFAD